MCFDKSTITADKCTDLKISSCTMDSIQRIIQTKSIQELILINYIGANLIKSSIGGANSIIQELIFWP